MNKKERGITLIALIITIIILLILAGVVLILTIGENGIINHAKTAKETYEEAQAREKLEIVLLDLQTDKLIKLEYNEGEYINERLTNKGFSVNENIVLVDGWQFEIDRSVPKVLASIGKGELEKNIKINSSSETSSDYTKAILNIEIEYEKEITEITLNGESVEVPEKIDGKYTIQREVTSNGIYSVIAKDVEDKRNIASIKISDIAEDMQIFNLEDMISFRDKVNTGATFEGRTVTLMNDIDLQGSETNQWIPIGKDVTTFKGTFDGNYKTISNLYINSNQYVGLGFFYKIDTNATLRNIKLEQTTIINSYTKAENYTGGICGYSLGTIQNCYVNGTIKAQNSVSITTEAGGICGLNKGIINSCYNNAEVYAKNSSEASGNVYGGGILGYNWGSVRNCYNTGAIKAEGRYSRTGGVCGFSGKKDGIIENCYNIGILSGAGKIETYIGGICGSNGNSSYSKGSIINSYCLDNTTYSSYYYSSGFKKETSGIKTDTELKGYATVLGNAWQDDDSNINDGYPILKWQVENK